MQKTESEIQTTSANQHNSTKLAIPKPPSKKKVAISSKEIVEQNYGINFIVYYYITHSAKKTLHAIDENQNYDKRQISDMLRGEFKDIELLEKLENISYEDKLEIGYPVFKKKNDKLLSDTPERVDAFYYYHLSPLIRESIMKLQAIL